jgi:hypothetical protein
MKHSSYASVYTGPVILPSYRMETGDMPGIQVLILLMVTGRVQM